MTFTISQSIKSLLEKSKSMPENDFMAFIEQSKSIEILDEVVDTDAISELENQFFSAIENMEDSIIGEFLTELIEKIELRYALLVEAIHKLNELLSNAK